MVIKTFALGLLVSIIVTGPAFGQTTDSSLSNTIELSAEVQPSDSDRTHVATLYGYSLAGAVIGGGLGILLRESSAFENSMIFGRRHDEQPMEQAATLVPLLGLWLGATIGGLAAAETPSTEYSVPVTLTASAIGTIPGAVAGALITGSAVGALAGGAVTSALFVSLSLGVQQPGGLFNRRNGEWSVTPPLPAVHVDPLNNLSGAGVKILSLEW